MGVLPATAPSCGSATGRIYHISMSLAPGSTLGPYEIRSRLGQGGMGVVYLTSMT